MRHRMPFAMAARTVATRRIISFAAIRLNLHRQDEASTQGGRECYAEMMEMRKRAVLGLRGICVNDRLHTGNKSHFPYMGVAMGERCL